MNHDCNNWFIITEMTSEIIGLMTRIEGVKIYLVRHKVILVLNCLVTVGIQRGS
jgi:hypothetical protein